MIEIEYKSFKWLIPRYAYDTRSYYFEEIPNGMRLIIIAPDAEYSMEDKHHKREIQWLSAALFMVVVAVILLAWRAGWIH